MTATHHQHRDRPSLKLGWAAGSMTVAFLAMLLMYLLSPTDEFGLPTGPGAIATRGVAFAALTIGIIQAFKAQRPASAVALALLGAVAGLLMLLVIEVALWASRLALGW